MVLASITTKQFVLIDLDVFLGTENFAVYKLNHWYLFWRIILEILFYVVGAWFLVSKSDLIADKLTRKSNDQLQLSATKADLAELLIIAIGMLVIVSSIPEILSTVSRYLYFNEYGQEDRSLYWESKNRKAELLYSVFKLAVGLLATTNARMIARRLMRIGDKDVGSE